jgi:magnesium chelatase subunit D
LHAGRAIYQPGVLTQSHPTLLLLPMAERLPDDTAAILGQVLDQGQVSAGRHLIAQDTFIGLVALDESLEDEPPMTGGLQERLGIWLDLRHMGRAGGEADNTRWLLDTLPSMDLPALRAHALQLDIQDAAIKAVCQTAETLGVNSLRASLATVRLAKVLAALRGSDEVQEEDLGRAARLVLTPRATRVPAPPDQQAAPPEPEPQNDTPPDQPPPQEPPEQSPTDPPPEPPAFDPQEMAELMLEAALASLPADVLAQLADHKTAAPAGRGQGRSGNRKPSFLRGTPMPPRPGNPRQGARLHVLATLNAAVPRQKLRRLPKHSRVSWRFAPKIFMCTGMRSTVRPV